MSTNLAELPRKVISKRTARVISRHVTTGSVDLMLTPVSGSSEPIPKQYIPLVPKEPESASGPEYLLLQHWEGIIIGLEGDLVEAKLRDLSISNSLMEIGVFSIEEIPESDRDLVELGAIFYWAIKFEISKSGTRKRVSEMRMKRSPKWSGSAIARMKKSGEELFEQFSKEYQESRTAEE